MIRKCVLAEEDRRKVRGRNHHPLFTMLRNVKISEEWNIAELHPRWHSHAYSAKLWIKPWLTDLCSCPTAVSGAGVGAGWGTQVRDAFTFYSWPQWGHAAKPWSKEEQLAHQIHALSDYLDSGYLVRVARLLVYMWPPTSMWTGALDFVSCAGVGMPWLFSGDAGDLVIRGLDILGRLSYRERSKFRHVCFIQWRERKCIPPTE